MTGIELVLLLAGAMTFTMSFLLPSDGNSESQEGTDPGSSSEKLKNALDSLMGSNEEEIRRRLREIAEDEADAAGDERKRNLEKLTNEKIMAVDEYSKTVLDAIEKNHKEVVFLYDMLNNKSADLKNTIRKAEQTKREVEAERAAEEQRAAQITKAARALREAVDKHNADVEALSAVRAASGSSAEVKKEPEARTEVREEATMPTPMQIIDDSSAEKTEEKPDRPEPVTQATPIMERIKKLRENEKMGGVPKNMAPKTMPKARVGMPTPEEIEASIDAGAPIFETAAEETEEAEVQVPVEELPTETTDESQTAEAGIEEVSEIPPLEAKTEEVQEVPPEEAKTEEDTGISPVEEKSENTVEIPAEAKPVETEKTKKNEKSASEKALEEMLASVSSGGRVKMSTGMSAMDRLRKKKEPEPPAEEAAVPEIAKMPGIDEIEAGLESTAKAAEEASEEIVSDSSEIQEKTGEAEIQPAPESPIVEETMSVIENAELEESLTKPDSSVIEEIMAENLPQAEEKTSEPANEVIEATIPDTAEELIDEKTEENKKEPENIVQAVADAVDRLAGGVRKAKSKSIEELASLFEDDFKNDEEPGLEVDYDPDAEKIESESGESEANPEDEFTPITDDLIKDTVLTADPEITAETEEVTEPEKALETEEISKQEEAEEAVAEGEENLPGEEFPLEELSEPVNESSNEPVNEPVNEPAKEKVLADFDLGEISEPVSISLSGKSRNEQVLSMYHDGKKEVEIAKALTMGVGEVKLVIELYDRDRSKGGKSVK